MVSERVKEAAKFASLAHAIVGHLRKHTGEPYIVHPTEVAGIVRDVGGTDEMIMAAYLHDTIEDCGIQREEIEAAFGPLVASYVEWLSDVYVLPEHGNRKVRKQKELERIAQAPAEVKTIKLADLISNTTSIVEHDPDFAKVYMREKLHSLPYLKEGNKRLFLEASQQLMYYFEDQNDLEAFMTVKELIKDLV